MSRQIDKLGTKWSCFLVGLLLAWQPSIGIVIRGSYDGDQSLLKTYADKHQPIQKNYKPLYGVCSPIFTSCVVNKSYDQACDSPPLLI
mmetsp:Transcript_30654/g.62607  ORF Transcript_30654/g.62607 Transcript_30654/m.62607 type:complete len:88 (-) Transcript_30654:909-1172(-)